MFLGSGYAFGRFYPKDWLEDLTDEEWSKIAKKHGTPPEEYKGLTKGMSNHDKALTLLNGLMATTGINSLLLEPNTYSENEVKIRLNKALTAQLQM